MSSNSPIPAIQSPVFWGEIAPCEHIAQFYEHDDVLLDTLGGFVGGGLKQGEGVIVLATEEHLKALEQRLQASGVNLEKAKSQDQYITVLAEDALGKFMVNQWPDDQLFFDFVAELIARAQNGGRRVRAFGELVALMWARGQVAATVRLEFLWHQLCHQKSFSLFCAYPKAGFTEDPLKSLDVIRATHSRII
ncbi:MAG: MEDS domain-containing protein [Candidatus Sulfotelmatobacter sp.]